MKMPKNKYWLFLLILVGNIAFFGIVAYLLKIRFEENDDIMMCLIANGNYSGKPDCHLVFQNAIWGCLVSSLYRLTDSIEWYSVLFTIIHIMSLSIIAYCIIDRHKHSKPLLICYLTCIYTIWAVTIQSFQFTTTAGILCAAGCVLLLCDGNKPVWEGACAILISSLIRFQAAAFVGWLCAPLILLAYGKEKVSKACSRNGISVLRKNDRRQVLQNERLADVL